MYRTATVSGEQLFCLSKPSSAIWVSRPNGTEADVSYEILSEFEFSWFSDRIYKSEIFFKTVAE